ncbi:hypothetical protein KFK14_11475 [Sphingobium phenoxybenzoativorans]|uniref:Uncharacterized protein n=1 Tax=Sphingobium phenoxybenzoativorans TaxID=1592790 RepID=A0A975KAR3_9SPHN|nr:hypothetical protein [Sphingobium phenoxybenzoativorans]QUT07949.1 hypothetical protein KFK14_11475 [Sphingobium phenoxybenzoativorans]
MSDERVREELRSEIDRAINIERSTTRADLARKSGVNVHQIDQLLTRIPEKQRRVALADALSIAWALGERAVNALTATIGYQASAIEEDHEMRPMMIVATAMKHLAVITDAAADDRIDHVERPNTTEAADMLIATVWPLSSHGDSI